VLEVPRDIKRTSIVPAKRDRASVALANQAMMPLRYSFDLEQRGVSSSVLKHSRFAGSILEDWHRNVVFPHTDINGVCGA